MAVYFIKDQFILVLTDLKKTIAVYFIKDQFMIVLSDLKKTMAVLLESMLERLSRLEVQVHHVMNISNSSMANLTRPSVDQSEDSLHAEGTAI